ncbi:MAG TPA: phosphoribosylanthranilate isomerase [Nitrospirota bacterium]
MVRVKICGITNVEDAMFAARHGADALGFVFYEKSPRYIGPEAAGDIVLALPPFITPVGVFVDPPSERVMEVAVKSGVRVLQFHGDEPPEFCRSFGLPYVKALRVRDMRSLRDLSGYSDASAYLLDTYSEKEYGGTGVTFNWDVALEAKRFGRVILAGGLTRYNVADAVEHVAPYAVDVSSGVEQSKGKKDHDSVRMFIMEAKGII